MITDSSALTNFRNTFYELLPKRRDAVMNLLDAITSEAHRCQSVVQLSNAPCFERQYSSVTDAIADGLTQVDWTGIVQLIHQYAFDQKNLSIPKFILDATPNPRPFARKVADRTIVHTPNPAPGNRPISVGHQYSVLTQLPEDQGARDKHWLIPLTVTRVTSEQKGNEVGMQQLIDHLERCKLTQELCMSIGDSLYGTQTCRTLVAQSKNLVHMFRLNSKRNVFLTPTEDEKNQAKLGRKKLFGKKMALGDATTHTPCDQQTQTTWTTRQNKNYQVDIKCWNNMLLRGSRQFRSDQHPMNVIQITVKDTQGQLIFKRPLWLGVLGARRDEIELIAVYQDYRSRYDIEHFFRFGKQKLLLSTYQTPEVAHEESWWRLCALAYFQLYLAKSLSIATPQPWERYLPEYKNSQTQKIATASQTQRGFANLLDKIGTPARACVARGIPPGRMKGMTQEKRSLQPIKFKGTKPSKEPQGNISTGSGTDVDLSNPQKIDDLIKFVTTQLTKNKLSVAEFTKLLNDSS